MFDFWVPALGLIVAVGTVLLQALRRARPSSGAEEAADLRVYRDQLAEVNRDLARGVIAPDEGARLRAEVARRLLDADRASGRAAPTQSTKSWLPAGLVLGMLGSAVAGYVWLGAPGYPDLPIKERLNRATEIYLNRPGQEVAEASAGIKGDTPQDKDEAALLEQLRAAVAARPDDLQGHQLLAKSEMAVGNWPGARKAYEQAVELMGAQASPQDHAQLAEIMILAAGGLVTSQAEAELVTTLNADPKNGAARYYSGVMLAQVGRPDQAFALWRPLLDESTAADRWYAPIRQEIEELAQAAGIEYALPEAKGPDAAAVAAASQMTPKERQDMIKGMVGGLEARLMGQGGSAEDWAKLVNALAVLGDGTRALKAFDAGQVALSGDAAGLAVLKDAAKAAGITR